VGWPQRLWFCNIYLHMFIPVATVCMIFSNDVSAVSYVQIHTCPQLDPFLVGHMKHGRDGCGNHSRPWTVQCTVLRSPPPISAANHRSSAADQCPSITNHHFPLPITVHAPAMITSPFAAIIAITTLGRKHRLIFVWRMLVSKSVLAV
jgi:hypothetical protein